MAGTGFYTHKDCGKHEMGTGHPECPARLDVIEDRLLLTGVADGLQRREAPLASLADLALAHDTAYLDRLRGLTLRLQEDALAGGSSHASLDPDTALNVHTWQALLRGAGAALAATDAVLAGELRNAFCAVRPPGHHAERDRAMGFCFVNHVALAARHALERHGLRRVAIVDFDVHHGNGTEHILAGDERVLMVSFFQHPFYPHSGLEQPAANMLNLPVPAYTRGMELRELVELMWTPRIDAFRPELLLVSAGFDAHQEDEMGQLRLNDQDYVWLSEWLVQMARRHASGRLVSMLEGGYALDALARCVELHVRTLAGL
jgi:acetoin utilization deacetylase AcuC-like enzyme